MNARKIYLFLCICGLFTISHAAYEVGDRVVCTEDNVNVRSTPGGGFLGQQDEGDPGSVIDGPKIAEYGGTWYVWWKVNFDSGADGWIVNDYLDNEPLTQTRYSLTPGSVTVNEGAGSITFTISRSGGKPAETLFASTVQTEGDANNNDYEGLKNVEIDFRNGETSDPVRINITNNPEVEGDETYGLIIQRNASDSVSTYLDKSTFTIQDDDASVEPTNYSFTPNSLSVSEDVGTITFTISRSGGKPAETVYISTTTGEGYVNNQDYHGIIDRAITFSDGETSDPVSVSIIDDSITEGPETFGVILQRTPNPSPNVFDAKTTFTINDNDSSDSSQDLITRNEVIATARAYAEYEWVCGEENVNNGYSYFRAGQRITGVAYNWGGNDTINSFQSKIQSGAKAGWHANIDTSAYGISRWAGVDCSGFVGRCWGISEKINTTDHIPSAAYTSRINWNELRAGDVVNKPGHVRLFHKYDELDSNKIWVYESEANGGRVKYWSYFITDLQSDGYLPYRFNGIVEDTDRISPSIQSFSISKDRLSTGEVLTLSYRVSDSGGAGLSRVELWRASGTGEPSDPSWQEISRGRVSGNGPVAGTFNDSITEPGTYWYGLHVVDEAGNLEHEREAGIGPKNVVFNQANPSAYTQITISEWRVGSSAGDYDIEVSSNTGWEVESIPGWIQVTPITGQGNGIIRVQYNQNEVSNNRKAELFIGGEKHTLIQHGFSDVLFWEGEQLTRLEGQKYQHDYWGGMELAKDDPFTKWFWVEGLFSWLLVGAEGLTYSDEYGVLTRGANPRWAYSSFFGWTHFGADAGQYDGWVHTERFGWMKFIYAGDDTSQQPFFWSEMMNSWVGVNSDGSFHSFQWGQLTPLGLDRYVSSIFGGLTMGDWGGWVASDRFGWMWANGDGTWFWSVTRQEWLGITESGGIWSTAEGRFL